MVEVFRPAQEDGERLARLPRIGFAFLTLPLPLIASQPVEQGWYSITSPRTRP